MGKRITIIQGHPDAQARHLGHALADEYAKGCEDSGHEMRRIEVAMLEFPILRTKEDFETCAPPPSILQAQDAIGWANHLVLFYPLWLGSMPALLKAFLEQVFRPGFAFEYGEAGRLLKKRLTGKSARIVVTMGMPASCTAGYSSPIVSRVSHGTSSSLRESLRSRSPSSVWWKG